MGVIGAVFARGGSKGVVGKNLRELNGETLVARAIRQALEIGSVDRVVLSTDSAAIAAEGVRAGAEVPWLRPTELAGDTSPEWAAWQHLDAWLTLEGETYDRILVAPCTAPLRSLKDLTSCVKASEEPGVDVVLTVTEAHHNPWFNMVTINGDGSTKLAVEPSDRIHRRQDAPKVYDVTTVGYVVGRSYLRTAASLFEGNTRAVIVPAERSLDIDTELDLSFAKFLLDTFGDTR